MGVKNPRPHGEKTNPKKAANASKLAALKDATTIAQLREAIISVLGLE